MLKSKTFIGAACLVAQPLLLNIIGIPAMAYIIRTLGPTAFGQWSVATSLVATTTFITNMGLRMHFVRSVAQNPDSARQAFSEQISLRVLLSVIAALLSVAICMLLRYPNAVLWCTILAAFGLVLTCISTTVVDLFQATHRLTSIATVNLIAGVCLTCASVLAMWLDAGPAGLAASYVVGPALSASIFLSIVQKRYFPVRPAWNPARFLEMLKHSRVMGAQLLIATIGLQVEALLVPKLVSIQQFGFFSAGTLIPKRLEIVPDGLSTAFYPILARSYREGPEKAAREITRFGLAMTVACLGIAVAVSLLAGPIASFFFPGRGALCADVLRLSIWWLPIAGITTVMGYALNAAGKEKEEAQLSIVANLVGIVSSALLISQFGVIGACWAWIIRAGFSAVVRVPCFLRTFTPIGACLPSPLQQRRRNTASSSGTTATAADGS